MLVPPGDPRALADAVVALLDGRGAAAARSARPRAPLAEQQYSWDAIAARLLEIYERSRAAPAPIARAVRSPWLVGAGCVPLVVLAAVGASAALLWWRGPDWDLVGDAFTAVQLAVGRRGDRPQPRSR